MLTLYCSSFRKIICLKGEIALHTTPHYFFLNFLHLGKTKNYIVCVCVFAILLCQQETLPVLVCIGEIFHIFQNFSIVSIPLQGFFSSHQDLASHHAPTHPHLIFLPSSFSCFSSPEFENIFVVVVVIYIYIYIFLHVPTHNIYIGVCIYIYRIKKSIHGVPFIGHNMPSPTTCRHPSSSSSSSLLRFLSCRY